LNVAIRIPELSIDVAFHGGVTIRFQTDAGPEMANTDQWFIQVPWNRSIVVDGTGYWRLSENPRVPG